MVRWEPHYLFLHLCRQLPLSSIALFLLLIFHLHCHHLCLHCSTPKPKNRPPSPAVKTQRESGDVAPCQRYKMAKLFIADTQDDGVEMLMLLHAIGEIMKGKKSNYGFAWPASTCDFMVSYHVVVLHLPLLSQQAVCCEDKIHCCPEGTTCDVAQSKCISSSTKKDMPMWAKLPARLRADWENQKGQICLCLTLKLLPHSEKSLFQL